MKLKTHSEEKLLAAIQFAIDLEDKGLQFYKQCLAKTRNARAMELFDYLVKAETGHKRVLTDLLKAVTKGDEAKIKKSIDDFVKLGIHNPLFSKEELEKSMRYDATLTGMFNQAMKFEQEGLKVYKEWIQRETDPEIKKLLKRLAADELIHERDIRHLGEFVFGISILSMDVT